MAYCSVFRPESVADLFVCGGLQHYLLRLLGKTETRPFFLRTHYSLLIGWLARKSFPHSGVSYKFSNQTDATECDLSRKINCFTIFL